MGLEILLVKVGRLVGAVKSVQREAEEDQDEADVESEPPRRHSERKARERHLRPSGGVLYRLHNPLPWPYLNMPCLLAEVR